MEWTRSGEDLFVRIDPNEEIHESLQNLADEIGFDAAAITSGIGRTRENQYGYMNEEGVYQRRNLPPPSEHDILAPSSSVLRCRYARVLSDSLQLSSRVPIPCSILQTAAFLTACVQH